MRPGNFPAEYYDNLQDLLLEAAGKADVIFNDLEALHAKLLQVIIFSSTY